MTKFIVIGYGWRAQFFYRIAKALPQEFEVTAGVLRTPERALEARAELGIYTTCELAEALQKEHDFVVLCVPRTVAVSYLEKLMTLGEAVLCETPPAPSVEELNRLWKLCCHYGGRIQVCEQYLYQPLYGAWMNVIHKGLLGEITNMSLSALHDYHAMSVFRHYLGAEFSNCSIMGRTYKSPVTATGSRAGVDRSGTVKVMERQMASVEFENGTSAFYDFSGEQYHSLIRTRRLNIQGVRGEINDMTVRYLDADNRAVVLDLVRTDLGVYNNQGWCHHGISMGGTTVYQNPFPGARLNDDEIAMAACLRGMREYTDGGPDVYSLREALQDTYLAFRMKEACEHPGTVVETSAQSWV